MSVDQLAEQYSDLVSESAEGMVELSYAGKRVLLDTEHGIYEYEGDSISQSGFLDEIRLQDIDTVIPMSGEPGLQTQKMLVIVPEDTPPVSVSLY